MLKIRPFREEDRNAVAAILNHDLPPDRRQSVDAWRASDAAMLGGEAYRRLVAGEPAVAYLEVTDMGTTHIGWRSIAGICEMELAVEPGHRQRGIGAALYEEAMLFARERGAHILRCWFYQSGPDCPAIAFLRKRGFVEQAGRQTSHLDLTRFDWDRFADAPRRAGEQGVDIFSYSDVADNVENRRRLFELRRALGSVSPDDSFETWASATMEGKDRSRDLLMIAALDDQWIGLSDVTSFDPKAGSARQSFTGTLPAYRGRGIATALKLACYSIMAQQGCRRIATSNRFDNAPMLAINRRLGFEPGVIEWTYDKPMAEHQSSVPAP